MVVIWAGTRMGPGGTGGVRTRENGVGTVFSASKSHAAGDEEQHRCGAHHANRIEVLKEGAKSNGETTLSRTIHMGVRIYYN
eukprot:181736-Rhodomonas_salina.1